MAFLLCAKDQIKVSHLPVHYKEMAFQEYIFFYDPRFCSIETDSIFIGFKGWKLANTPWCEIQIFGESIRITTDPMGMMPIWKNIQTNSYSSSLKFLNTELEPPMIDSGFVYRQRDFSPLKSVVRVLNAGSIIDYSPSVKFQNMSNAKESLYQSMQLSVGEIPKVNRVGVFLSGGVDSSVTAAMADQTDQIESIDTLTLGTEIGNEFKEALQLAKKLKSNHREVFLDKARILNLFTEVIEKNFVYDGLTAEILIQVLHLIKHVDGPQAVLTGYGSDLLFGGMLKHEQYMQVVGSRDTRNLVERTIWSGEFAPGVFWEQNIVPIHLYWHPSVIQTAMKIPHAMNFKQEHEKVVLREMAVDKGLLPKEIAYRSKIGMTNGTNVNRLFSDSLNLKSEHSYLEKNRATINAFKDFIK